jgi:hypothetical protein
LQLQLQEEGEEKRMLNLSFLGVLVLVLALYWQSIIEEVFAGFSPP